MQKAALAPYFKSPFVVMDTEFTTWEGAYKRDWDGANEWREIVQIAAIKIDPAQNFKETATFDVLVKPVINPILSDFFQELTHISQQQVDAEGLPFAQALEKFAQFAQNMPVWAYGGDDKVLLENCIIHNLHQSHIQPFFDIRMIVKMLGDKPHDYSSGTLHKAADIQMDGHVHNALHDCRSIVAYLKHHFRS